MEDINLLNYLVNDNTINLSNMNINDNNIVSLFKPINKFNSINNLKELILKENNLSCLPLDLINFFKQLNITKLDISDNPIKILNHIDDYKTFVEDDHNDNNNSSCRSSIKLTNEFIQTASVIKAAPKLKVLDISLNKKNEAFALLTNLPNIEILNGYKTNEEFVYNKSNDNIISQNNIISKTTEDLKSNSIEYQKSKILKEEFKEIINYLEIIINEYLYNKKNEYSSYNNTNINGLEQNNNTTSYNEIQDSFSNEINRITIKFCSLKDEFISYLDEVIKKLDELYNNNSIATNNNLQFNMYYSFKINLYQKLLDLVNNFIASNFTCNNNSLNIKIINFYSNISNQLIKNSLQLCSIVEQLSNNITYNLKYKEIDTNEFLTDIKDNNSDQININKNKKKIKSENKDFEHNNVSISYNNTINEITENFYSTNAKQNSNKIIPSLNCINNDKQSTNDVEYNKYMPLKNILFIIDNIINSKINYIKNNTKSKESNKKILNNTCSNYEAIYSLNNISKLIYIKTAKQYNPYKNMTLFDYMCVYFKNKYGVKSVCLENISCFVKSIMFYSKNILEVSLFSKILRNNIDEEFYLVITKLKSTIFNLLILNVKNTVSFNNATEEIISKSDFISFKKIVFLNRHDANLINYNELNISIILENEWKNALNFLYDDNTYLSDILNIINEYSCKNKIIVNLKQNHIKCCDLINLILIYEIKLREEILYKFTNKITNKFNNNSIKDINFKGYFNIVDIKNVFVDIFNNSHIKNNLNFSSNKNSLKQLDTLIYDIDELIENNKQNIIMHISLSNITSYLSAIKLRLKKDNRDIEANLIELI